MIPTTQATYQRFGAAPLLHIATADGWQLCEVDCDRGREFAVIRGEECKFLGVSRFFFAPTQARFDWLAAHNFIGGVLRPHGVRTPIDDEDIDAALDAQREEAAA